MKDRVNIFWFRRDLRLKDNTGLYHALNAGLPVLPLFIYDTDILDKLESPLDERVEFINSALNDINSELKSFGSSLLTLSGRPAEVWKSLISDYEINEVFANHDYEPDAIKRDKEIHDLLLSNGIKFNTYKDQVIFEKNEVVKSDGKPYTVFTPYSKAWLNKFSIDEVSEFKIDKLTPNFYRSEFVPLTLKEISFNSSGISFPSKIIRRDIIKNYSDTRDLPFIDGTSRLSVHLRFGTISIRDTVKQAAKLNEIWLKELIWREFFMMILYQFPYSAVSSFRPEYDNIEWLNNESDFKAWCSGKTGFPVVDAGMRELNETGYMHNRVRMITASFLCKDLLIDWRWGERYFAAKLLDYEMSSNIGNWQWAAGTGCDAAPYFRIFNPQSQQKKFDPDLKYIKKWVPELNDKSYPKPIVDHKTARERALIAYKKALSYRK